MIAIKTPASSLVPIELASCRISGRIECHGYSQIQFRRPNRTFDIRWSLLQVHSPCTGSNHLTFRCAYTTSFKRRHGFRAPHLRLLVVLRFLPMRNSPGIFAPSPHTCCSISQCRSTFCHTIRIDRGMVFRTFGNHRQAVSL